MPKEYIISETERRLRDEMGGRREAVRIGWQRDAGYVQVATVLQAGTDGATTEHVSEVDQGQFVTLDRSALNTLIRTLRKARDQAYGSDA